MTAKPTSLSLDTADKNLVFALREATGIRSTTEVVRYALRRAVGLAEPAVPADGSATEVERLRECLKWHRDALALWSPTGFTEMRAKAAAEESLRMLGYD